MAWREEACTLCTVWISYSSELFVRRTDLGTLEVEGKLGPATASGSFLYASGDEGGSNVFNAIRTPTIPAGSEACLTFDYSLYVSIASVLKGHFNQIFDFQFLS